MRQIVSMLLVVIVVVNVITNLPEALSLISQAFIAGHYSQNDVAVEGINLNFNAPNLNGEITLVAAPAMQPVCQVDRQVISGWPNNQGSPLGFGDQDSDALNSGRVIPDDPPRYKLDSPDYNQYQIVLWASDSVPQTQAGDEPLYICTGYQPVSKIKQDSC